MRRGAERVAAELRAQRTLGALDEAVLSALLSASDALDRQPGSASLLHEWRNLIRDLRLDAPSKAQRDLDDELENYRATVRSPIRVMEDSDVG